MRDIFSDDEQTLPLYALFRARSLLFLFFLLAAEQNIHRYGKCLCYIVHTTMFLAENAKRGREQACTDDTYSSHGKWFDLSEEGNLCQKSPQLTQMLGIMTAFMGTRRPDKKEKRNHVNVGCYAILAIPMSVVSEKTHGDSVTQTASALTIVGKPL